MNEMETRRLLDIARTADEPTTKRLAGECVVLDLEKAGQANRLWNMQFDSALEKEVRIEAGIAAVDLLVAARKFMKLVHMRGCSPFHQVNVEVALEMEKVGILKPARRLPRQPPEQQPERKPMLRVA